MNQTAIHTLEFEQVKEKLMSYAISEQGKEKVRKLQPFTDLHMIEISLHETTEAKAIVEKGGSVPLHGLHEIELVMEKLGKGVSLLPDQLTAVLGLLETGKKLKRYMNDKQMIAPQVSSYARSIHDLEDLAEEIVRCIRFGRVDDQASKDLAKVRKKKIIVEDRIKSKLENILRSSAYRDYIQDGVVSMRDGRYVIPIKKEYRRHLEGNILDSSASGQTVFIEPAEVKKLQTELQMLKAEEEIEEEKILYYLTGMVEGYKHELSINIETMAHYDFLFAKAKLSRSYHGRAVHLNMKNYIHLKGAKHPLIGESAVPLDVTIGKSYSALVITGPNTGGKTVAIKTIGLLALMVQAGMHVPVQEGSEFPVFLDVLVDIGDGQSIDQSLSTFSAHIRNMISILEQAKPRTLVIVDELGTGTDPMEGMGLAIAILEQLNRRGATILATTHYSEIKEFAEQEEAFENGSMEFDLETLRPLYRLRVGKAGESQAFPIALRLGMDRTIIERAHQITYKETKHYDESSEIARSTHQVVITTDREKWGTEKEKGTDNKDGKEGTGAGVDTRNPSKPMGIVDFAVGDRVYIRSLKTSGIVYELENHKGEFGVLVGQKKLKVNKKRLSLQIKSEKLYPENYDMAIVFDSKETRKKERIMKKRHVEGLTIDRTVE